MVVAFLCILFPAQSSLKAFADGEGKKGSTIGGVNVTDLKEDDIKAALQNAIQEWQEESIIIQGGGAELTIDPQEIQFNIDRTMQNYKSLTDKPFFLFWMPDKEVHIPIEISESEIVRNRISNMPIWDTDETYSRVISQASYLRSHEIEAVVADTTLLENERIALTIETIPETAQGVHDLVEMLNETVLKPNEPFSLLENLGDMVNLANREGLDFVSSMVYFTVLQGKVDIIERHSQGEIPNYLQPGLDARVDSYSKKDLQFANFSANPYLLKLAVEEDSLKVELYSTVKEADVKIRINKESIAPRIINRYSNDLPIGGTKLIQEGKPGLRVTVTRVMAENGEVEEQQISRDYYAPVNRIVLNSSRQPEETSGTITNSGKTNNSSTKVENLDLDGDGLPDYDDSNEVSDEEIGNLQNNEGKGKTQAPKYDKGGNLITP